MVIMVQTTKQLGRCGSGKHVNIKQGYQFFKSTLRCVYAPVAIVTLSLSLYFMLRAMKIEE